MKRQLSAMDGLWSTFNKKFVKELRQHRAKFLPDDEFNCNTLAKVVKPAVEGEGLPVKTVVTVVQVSPPQESKDFVWRRMRRPYVSAKVILGDGTERPCNLESLKPL